MKLGIGNDQAAYDMKLEIKEYLESLGHEVTDYGSHSAERTDYPIWGRAVAEAVTSGEVERGIIICGSGVGISIAANKVPGVRCALCTEAFTATASRAHNDANVIALGARVIGAGVAEACVRAFRDTAFEGGRHSRRVAKLTTLDDSSR